MNKKPECNEEVVDSQQILDAAISGDLYAFGILYQEHVQKIYNYIYYRTGNSSDAEDLTARVFQRALHHITRFKKKGVPFSAWLYRIAHNLVANWYRDNNRKKEIPLEDLSNVAIKQQLPEVSIINSQEIAALLNCIHKMSSERQLLIILKYLEEMTNKEIAQIMGKSEGAVKSLYHRTLFELREKMGIK